MTHNKQLKAFSETLRNIYSASIVVSSGIKWFDVGRVVSDENWCTITAVLDQKPLVFFEEISAPLQQTGNKRHRTHGTQQKVYLAFYNKKHLKNVGPICHCETFYIAIHQVSLLSHAATVARRLRIGIHDDNNNDNA